MRLTILDQRFNLCQISKYRTILPGWTKHMRSALSIELKCPINKGLKFLNQTQFSKLIEIFLRFIVLKSSEVSKSLVTQLTPQLGHSNVSSPNNELSFNITVILQTKLKRKFVTVLRYQHDNFKMSLLV
jgi:hypothetical protein